jgi:septation ring formation regulator EzrA
MAGQNIGLKLLVVILLVISLALGGGGYFMLKKEQDRSAQLEMELTETQRKYKDAQSEVEQQNTKISGLSESLEKANSNISKLNIQLSDEQRAKKEALSKIEQLTSDLAKQSGLSGDLQKKLADSQGTLRDVDKRLKEMESQLKTTEAAKVELEKKVKSLEEKTSSVELGKIVVSPEPVVAAKKSETPKAAAKILEGKVLVVNKDYKFAVINLGSKDGVAAGMVFSVMHSGKNIGDVKVEKVHESMSAAGFVTAEVKDKIIEGDSVTQK